MFNFFKQPTDEAYAARNLTEARLLLLKALASREYADSIVSQKVTEIKRLEKYMEDAEAKKVQKKAPLDDSKRLGRFVKALKAKQVDVQLEVANVSA